MLTTRRHPDGVDAALFVQDAVFHVHGQDLAEEHVVEPQVNDLFDPLHRKLVNTAGLLPEGNTISYGSSPQAPPVRPG